MAKPYRYLRALRQQTWIAIPITLVGIALMVVLFLESTAVISKESSAQPLALLLLSLILLVLLGFLWDGEVKWRRKEIIQWQPGRKDGRST